MKAELIDLVDCIEHLPAMPATTVKLVQLLSDKAASIDRILDVVQYDQNLTLQILKLCNSAYFALNRHIYSLRDALAYLGAKQIMQIVLGIHCNSILLQPQNGYGLLPGMLWRHSAAVALAAERLGAGTEQQAPTGGLLFTAGLLHDAGKVILDQVLTDSYSQVLEFLALRRMNFHEAEREILGYSHTEAGEMLMRHWQLPEEIAAASRYHHEPETYPGVNRQVRKVIDLVHLADCLVLSMGLGLGNDGLLYKMNAELADLYGIKMEALDLISAQVLDDLNSLEQMYHERQG